MCLECDKFFEDARYLRNHLRAVHDSVDKSEFVCLFACLFVHDSETLPKKVRKFFL